MLTWSSGSLSSRINPNPPTEDEILTRALSEFLIPNLLAKCSQQSCSGISFKSQALYLIVYVTRYLGNRSSRSYIRLCPGLEAHYFPTDIFWTFTTGSVYNTSFKLLFLAAQSYTVYLMLNDYKPTHDPNIDTFKVQYLLGGSAVLAVLFPYRYQVTEVGSLLRSRSLKCPMLKLSVT